MNYHPLHTSMTGPLHVLLVEDDEDDITFFELAIRKQDTPVELTTLTDGDQVMPYLAQASPSPQVLLLDLNLPRLNGREVLQLVKDSPVGRDIPVFVLTTSSAPEDIDYCLNNGAEQFLTKPTSLDELAHMVADIIATVEK